MRVRKAIRRDAKQLAQLAERTFRDTFGAVNTPKNMDSFCKTNYSEDVQASEIENPDAVTLLSEFQGVLVGFAQILWGAAPKCVSASSPGEIQRLYVAGEWHGKGIAQDLMKVCFEEMKRRGSDVVWLGVWEKNPRAIAFYKKCGFMEVGEKIFRLGDDPQRDVVMSRLCEGF